MLATRVTERVNYQTLVNQDHSLDAHCALLVSSYQRLLGKPLIDNDLLLHQGYDALFEAGFGLLSHGTESPPIFNYGNRLALELFERTWSEFTQMPSRQSAEQDERAERERLLKAVTEQGHIEDYKGVRISATGKRFYIDKTTVWNLVDDDGACRGQAAAIFRWQPL